MSSDWIERDPDAAAPASDPATRPPRRRWSWYLKQVMPRTLFWRSVVILFTPLLLLQVIATFIFFDRHWDTVTYRLATAVGGEITLAATYLATTEDPVARQAFLDQAAHAVRMRFHFEPDGTLPGPEAVGDNTVLSRSIARVLRENMDRPFHVTLDLPEGELVVSVALPDGLLVTRVPERRLFSSTAFVFILWLIASSLILFGIALIFMRNQIRPIRRLAVAAERFGRGLDSPHFRPAGALEVRQAAAAFIGMRDRIKRHIDQRTEMLAGVSHDLRTPLTRMRLQLAMLADREAAGDLLADVEAMQQMIDGYLAFARGAGDEPAVPTALPDLVEAVIAERETPETQIALTVEPSLPLANCRPLAMSRCLGNLLDNAIRYATLVRVSLEHDPSGLRICVDDDGPGIPAAAREDALRPFVRLDPSRNTETGGVGLGLPIARDIARRHGGDLTVADSPLGGLRVVVTLPA